MGKLKIILTFTACLYSIVNYGQDKQVDVSIERDSMLIGEQIYFNLSIEADSDQYIIPPSDDVIIPDRIELIDKKIDSIAEKGYKKLDIKYLITGFDSGYYQFPPSPVILLNHDIKDTVFTASLNLDIYMPAVDTTSSIKDIKSPINTPLTFKELFPWIAAGLGFILLLSAAVFFYQLITGKRKITLKPTPVIPPHEKALSSLNQLKKEKIWQKGRVKEFYIILSDTIRIYIEERYGIDAMEMITSDIIQKFRRYAQDDPLLIEILENLLNLSDMVKFAKEDPAPVENETNLNNAFIFIEKTKPFEVLSEQNAEVLSEPNKEEIDNK